MNFVALIASLIELIKKNKNKFNNFYVQKNK